MINAHSAFENIEQVRENCKRRRINPDLIDQAYNLDKERKNLIKERDSLIHQRRQIEKTINQGSDEDRNNKPVEAADIGWRIDAHNGKLGMIEKNLRELLLQIPNHTHPIVQDDNVIVCVRGEVDEDLHKDHAQIGRDLDLMDFDTASKITGQKFYYLKNDAVLLEMALASLALKTIADFGFNLHTTPDLAREDIVEDMGFNPRSDASQIYKVQESDLCLVGTSEITLGGFGKNRIFDAKELPLKMGGLSHCFRREAGAPGREGRGLYRVHQFTKVEMFAFCMPDQSDVILRDMVDIQKYIYEVLELPYRVVLIGAADLGGPAYVKYDLEVWMPGRKDFGEVTSASNCTDYQARRLHAKWKSLTDKGFVHTLNGTAMAVPRTIIAILENNQQEDGSVVVPQVLREYVGKEVIRMVRKP